MYKRVYFLLIVVLLPFLGFGQQDPMYSQYMFNPLSVNPAYAGSLEALSVAGLFRKQWLNIPGSPMTATLSAHTPTPNRKHGFGINLVADQISYIQQSWLNISYAYILPLPKDIKLGMGLQATGHYYRVNWSKAEFKDPSEPVVTGANRNYILPNVGAGVFLYAPNWYFGASVPRILVNTLTTTTPGISISDKSTDNAALRRHYFIMGGYVFKVHHDVKLKPSVLLKYVYGAPFQADMNLQVYLFDKYGVGVSYRTGDGIVALLEYRITDQLRAGYAYDYPLTSLNGFTWGSHEIMIAYDFRFKVNSVITPRLF